MKKLFKLVVISMAILVGTLSTFLAASAAVITDGTAYYTAGDANGDGLVDIRDLVRLKKCILSRKLSPATDFSADRAVPDAEDLAILKKILLGVDNSLWSENFK